jgi:hypothetical protein
VYFIPGLTGLIKYLVSFLFRLIPKLIADMTGMLMARNAYEMGAATTLSMR